MMYYFLLINLVTFALRGYDKRQAVRGKWRVREKHLLWCVFAGGGIGALAGQEMFRHKTIKGRFVWKVYGALAVWGLGIVGYLIF